MLPALRSFPGEVSFHASIKGHLSHSWRSGSGATFKPLRTLHLEGIAVVCLSQSEAAQRINNLVGGLPSPLRQRRLLLMLQGYFDDSGSDHGQSVFTLAGYALQAEKWASFVDDWDKVLKQRPAIPCFKMTDAFGGGGVFGTLSSEFRKAKTRELLAVIQSHKPDGIGVYLTWDEWLKFAANLKSAAKDQPYAVLFFQLIDEFVAYEVNKGIYPEKAQLDFDHQGNAG